MDDKLMKREKDFLAMWKNEFIERQQDSLSEPKFPAQSKQLVKNIVEASQTLKEDISSEEIIALGRVIQLLDQLQEQNICNEDLINYLDSLLTTMKKALSETDQKHPVEKFENLIKHLISFIKTQNDRQCLLEEKVHYLENKFESNILGMVGTSKTIKRLSQEIKPILDNTVTVLVEGETGTGKELMARAIFQNSTFANGPFIALNCAAIPEDLMEAEMFGYKRGSFTDAQQDRPGKIELAANGVLFLDEINELPLKLQAKLLRVIQERKVVRIGESKERSVDFKLICATNKDLKNLVEQGHFREDLFYRINVYTVPLPPLRERTDDIEPLANYFLAMRAKEFNKPVTRLSPDAMILMKNYRWPGNIRELDNVITRAVLKAKKPVLDTKDLDIFLTVSNHRDDIASLKEVEREHIAEALMRTQRNLQKTAKQLGITRTTLYNKIREYDLS